MSADLIRDATSGTSLHRTRDELGGVGVLPIAGAGAVEDDGVNSQNTRGAATLVQNIATPPRRKTQQAAMDDLAAGRDACWSGAASQRQGDAGPRSPAPECRVLVRQAQKDGNTRRSESWPTRSRKARRWIRTSSSRLDGDAAAEQLKEAGPPPIRGPLAFAGCEHAAGHVSPSTRAPPPPAAMSSGPPDLTAVAGAHRVPAALPRVGRVDTSRRTSGEARPVMREAVASAGLRPADSRHRSHANQRKRTWLGPATGPPYPPIVWRTPLPAPRRSARAGHARKWPRRPLLIDPYFSGDQIAGSSTRWTGRGKARAR